MALRKVMVPLMGRYEADVPNDLGLASLRAGFALVQRPEGLHAQARRRARDKPLRRYRVRGN